MTLPTSGPISASMINAELGRDSNARFHINGADERALAGVSAGLVTFADFYGKSRGFPTPQVDYPDPVEITKSVEWSGPATNLLSLTFDTDGILTTNGTPDETMPTYWYQGNTPPVGYKLLVTLVSAVFVGDTDDIEIYYVDSSFWQSLGIGINFGPWIQIRTSVVPLALVSATIVYDIAVSDGTNTIVTFRATLALTVTPP